MVEIPNQGFQIPKSLQIQNRRVVRGMASGSTLPVFKSCASLSFVTLGKLPTPFLRFLTYEMGLKVGSNSKSGLVTDINYFQ